jgi:ribosomal protein S20
MSTLIVHPENKEQLSALKAFMKAFNIAFEENKQPYNAQFVNKMKVSKQQAANGETVKITLDEIWK